jgi:hypothetical protein
MQIHDLPKVHTLPNDVINIIFDYDGRIKYKKGKYVNIIHKRDVRYDIVRKVILKKKEILKNIELHDSSFYLEFSFDIDNRVGLCYDYNFSYKNRFEICYYDTRNGWEQIRTFI